MTWYFLKRLGWSVVTIFIIVVINFFIIQLAPGDPVQSIIGDFPAPAEYVEQVRREFGLDQPIHVRLAAYIWNLLQGNLGFSFANRKPVLDLIIASAGNTLMLIVPAILLSAAIGIAFGLAAASREGKAADAGLTALTLFGYSIPVFWLGQILVLVFAINLGLLPSAGMYSMRVPATGWGRFQDLLLHMLLPLFCLMTFLVAIFARTSRASILGVIRSDFVMTAAAKGLSQRYILWHHVLPNAMLPIIALFGYQFGGALTSSLLTETVFAWPGIGNLFVNSIARRDFPVMQGILLFATAFVVIANLLADIAYTMLDPRVRRSLGVRNA
jgi:peptide/nickel transport system permease protein